MLHMSYMKWIDNFLQTVSEFGTGYQSENSLINIIYDTLYLGYK